MCMLLHLCVCVYMGYIYICSMYKFMNVCIHVSMHICAYVHTYICTVVYMVGLVLFSSKVNVR